MALPPREILDRRNEDRLVRDLTVATSVLVLVRCPETTTDRVPVRRLGTPTDRASRSILDFPLRSDPTTVGVPVVPGLTARLRLAALTTKALLATMALASSAITAPGRHRTGRAKIVDQYLARVVMARIGAIKGTAPDDPKARLASSARMVPDRHRTGRAKIVVQDLARTALRVAMVGDVATRTTVRLVPMVPGWTATGVLGRRVTEALDRRRAGRVVVVDGAGRRPVRNHRLVE